MGGVLSLFKKNEEDFEEILSSLEKEITTTQQELANIRTSERKSMAMLGFFSFLTLITCLLCYFFYLESSPSIYNKLVQSSLLWLPFILFYSLYRLLGYYYWRKKLYYEETLEHLITTQELKVEELKKKTSYYTTRTLLERFDSPAKSRPLAKGDASLQAKPPTTPMNSAKAHRGSLTEPRKRHNNILATPYVEAMASPFPTPMASKPHSQESTPMPLDSRRKSSIQKPQSTPKELKNWYDRLLDKLIGEDTINSNTSKYALICSKCHYHNGLVFPEDYHQMIFECARCSYKNSNKSQSNSSSAVHSESQIRRRSVLEQMQSNQKDSRVDPPMSLRDLKEIPSVPTSQTPSINNSIEFDSDPGNGETPSKAVSKKEPQPTPLGKMMKLSSNSSLTNSPGLGDEEDEATSETESSSALADTNSTPTSKPTGLEPSESPSPSIISKQKRSRRLRQRKK